MSRRDERNTRNVQIANEPHVWNTPTHSGSTRQPSSLEPKYLVCDRSSAKELVNDIAEYSYMYDLELACGESKIPAHSLILARHSGVSEILARNPKRTLKCQRGTDPTQLKYSVAKAYELRPSDSDFRPLVQSIGATTSKKRLDDLSTYLHHQMEYLQVLMMTVDAPGHRLQEIIDQATPKFADATVVARIDSRHDSDGATIRLPVHRFILCSRSSYFAAAFSSDMPSREAKTQTIQFNHSANVVAALLHHLYTGSTTWLTEQLYSQQTDLLMLAHELGVSSLQTFLVEWLKERTTLKNAGEILNVSFDLPKSVGYGLRMRALEEITAADPSTAYDPDFWKSLPSTLKEEIKLLRNARSHNIVGKAALGCARELVGMLKETRVEMQERLESLKKRFAEDEKSVQEFESRVETQNLAFEQRVASGILQGDRARQAQQLLLKENEQVQSRKQWLEKQRNLVISQQGNVAAFNEYTNEQQRQYRALQRLQELEASGELDS